MTAAVDCSTVVVPTAIESWEFGSGLIFGLTAALYNEIDRKAGCSEHFNNYRMMRINEAPAIGPSGAKRRGGRAASASRAHPVAAPALANALFAATGVRLRSLPIDRKQLASGKAA